MDLRIIKDYDVVFDHFRKRLWESDFDRKTLQRARGYVTKGKVQKIGVEQEFYEIKSVRIYGVVSGSFSEVYFTSIFFGEGDNGKWSYDTHCSCPVGQDCKHIAAVLMTVEKGLKIRPSSEKIDAVNSWLEEIAEIGAPEVPVSLPPKTRALDTFLAYCIWPSKLSYESEFTLRLHVGRRLKNGNIRLQLNSDATADPLKQPKYMSDEDILPAVAFRRLSRSSYYYGQVPLSIEGGVDLMLKALKTGRLFYISDRRNFRHVTQGEPIVPQPIWEELKGGSTRPALLPSIFNDAPWIESNPPFYLDLQGDPDEVKLREIDVSEHSLELLKKWQQGPILKPEQVAPVVISLEKSGRKLAKPKVKKQKVLSKVEPKPRLHLTRANPFTHGGLHYSGRPEPIVAKLTFNYDGHLFQSDLDAHAPHDSSFVSAKKDVIYQVPRDVPAELRAIEELVENHHVIPAIIWDSQVDPIHRNALLSKNEIPMWEIGMVHFLTTSVPKLRDLGWEVSIDASAEVEVQKVTEDHLETSLTDHPEGGIDWFQFSASYLTPDGDSHSLLPIVSEFLAALDFSEIDETIEKLPKDSTTLVPSADRPNAYISLPTKRLMVLAKVLRDLFGEASPEGPLHKLQAASLADVLEMDSSQTLKDLAALGQNLKNITSLPKLNPPKALKADLRDYQLEGFQWMQFLARHALHGILADDMGLGKTVQTLAHLQAEVSGRRTQKLPSLVLAPTSVVGNWAAEAKKFTPKLKTLTLQGPERKENFSKMADVQLVVTSYALIVRDFDYYKEQEFHLVILDEAQYIKNPAAKVAQLVCKLSAKHRISLSGTPLENHLGELWSQMRFLMPGLLGSSEAFARNFRTPIEKHQDGAAQQALSSRVASLILRRTKDQVATELPPKTEILHTIALNPAQVDLYETVRVAMDDRVRDAIAEKGLAKSQIIVLDALLKLRQICCHPKLLKLPAAQKVKHSAKLDFLTDDLLPTLLEEGRKILIFSTFTTMLAMIQKHLEKKKIPFAKITGSTKDRQKQIDSFQNGEALVFLISLKAGGTGLNLTAADTVIHYDPWWNPAAENQATDRAYRIGQDKPVFVHKLITEGSIEERIVELQTKKAKLVEALLSEKTSKLRLDQETLGNLLAPIT